jgi:hypothetical protein
MKNWDYKRRLGMFIETLTAGISDAELSRSDGLMIPGDGQVIFPDASQHTDAIKSRYLLVFP